jgi:hypothetical protein
MQMNEITRRAADARIRRAATRLKLSVKKSRWRLGSMDNHGEYQILNPYNNTVVAGARFDMSITDVAAWLAGIARDEELPELARDMDTLSGMEVVEEGASAT